MDYAAIMRDATERKRALVAEIEKLDALIASAAALAGVTVSVPPTAPKVQTASRKTTSLLGSPTRIAVGEILTNAGTPMQTRDLVPLVRGRGIEVGGKDAVATLSARLSNSAEFRLIKGFGWWFKDRPLPIMKETVLNFEVADTSSKDESATSVSNQGGGEDAATLASDKQGIFD